MDPKSSSSDEREDILSNGVLNDNTPVADPAAGEAATEAAKTGSNPPCESEAEEISDNPMSISPEVTSDESETDKENKKRKKRVYVGNNEDAEQSTNARGHVDVEVNIRGNIMVSVTVNVNHCPLQNLTVRRFNHFQ